MESCVYIPNCRNKEGNLVPSKLFQDLLKYTENDRKTALKFYSVGTNARFINAIGKKAEFDENGQITLASFLKNSGLSIELEKLVKLLNKDLGAGNYSYQEAMSRISQFNVLNQFNGDYMATMSRNNNGSYVIKVVSKTEEEKEKLKSTIKSATLQDKLKALLASHGVEVGFLDDGDTENGRYSTLNAEKNANGLYNLIKIKDGYNGDKALAEETGHFIIGAMGLDPLVLRLVDNMTEEVQKEVFGEEYEIRDMGTSAQRECAGVLVGRALERNYNLGNFGNLINRIITKAKSLFYSITGNEVKKAIADSQLIADLFARDFLNDNFKGTVENALSEQEELFKKFIFSKPKEKIITTLELRIKSIFKTVDDIILKLDMYEDKEDSQKLKDILSDYMPGISSTHKAQSILNEQLTVRALATVLESFKEILAGKDNLFKTLRDLNIAEDFSNLDIVGKKLGEIQAIVDGAKEIIKSIKELLKENPKYEEKFGRVYITVSNNTTLVNANKLLTNLEDFLTRDIENQESLLKVLNEALSKYMHALSSLTVGSQKLYYALGAAFRQMMDEKKRAKKKEHKKLLREIEKEEALKDKEEEGTNAFWLHAKKLGELQEKADALEKQINDETDSEAVELEYIWSILPRDLSRFEFYTRTSMNYDITGQMISREIERQTYQSRLNSTKTDIRIKHLKDEMKSFDIYMDEFGNILTEKEFVEAKNAGRKVHHKRSLDDEDLYEKVYYNADKEIISKREYDLLPDKERSYRCTHYIISKYRRYELALGYEEFKQRKLAEFREELSAKLYRFSFLDKDGNEVFPLDENGEEVKIRNLKEYNIWYYKCKSENLDFMPVKKAGSLPPSVIRSLCQRKLQKIWLEWRKGYVEEGLHIEGNYEYNQHSGKWEIKDKYLNQHFLDMYNKINGFRVWYDTLISLKESLDAKLDDGATETYRAPLFREQRLLQRAKNGAPIFFKRRLARLFDEGTDRDIEEQSESITLNTIMQEYMPEDSGDDNTGGIGDNYVFDSDVHAHKRIRAYGIRKIENLDEMSTDFFTNLIMYGRMCNNYGVLNSLKNSLYASLGALKQREVGGKEDKGESRAYKRIEKTLNTRIFQKSDFEDLTIFSKKLKEKILKVLDFFTVWAARMYLGGNIHGGMVNWETGFHEIIREAMAAQHWDLKDWALAERIYLGFYRGRENKVTSAEKEIDPAIKIFWDSAFSRKAAVIERLGIVNALNAQTERAERNNMGKVGRFIDDVLFYPYSIGEKWMQTIPYIMMARNYKMYIPDDLNPNIESWEEERIEKKKKFDKRQEKLRKEGKETEEWIPEEEISLFDAYERSVGYYQWYKKGNTLRKRYITKEEYQRVLQDIALRCRDENPGKTDEELAELLPKYVNKKEDGNIGYDKEKIVDFEKNLYIKSKEALLIYKAAGEIIDAINEALNRHDERLALTDEQEEFLQKHNINIDRLDRTTWTTEKLKKLRDKQFFNERDEADFIVLTRHICSNLHGIYNKADRSVLQNDFLTKSIMAMRGYALGMFNARFGVGFTNSITGEYEEGYWRTYATVLKDIRYDWKSTARMLFLNFIGGKRTAALMESKGYSKTQIANMRRCKAQLFIMLLQYLMKQFLFGPEPPEEKKEREEEEKEFRKRTIELASNTEKGKEVKIFLNRKTDAENLFMGIQYKELRKQAKYVPTDELYSFYGSSDENQILYKLYSIYKQREEEQQRLDDMSEFEFLAAKILDKWESGELFKAIAYADLDRTFLELASYSAFNLRQTVSEAGRVAGIVPIGLDAASDIIDLAKLTAGAGYYRALYSEEEIEDILKNLKQVANPFEKVLFKEPKDVFYVRGNKALLVERGTPKWQRKLAKMTPYYKYMYFLSDPYKAAENYRFFNVKNK